MFETATVNCRLQKMTKMGGDGYNVREVVLASTKINVDLQISKRLQNALKLVARVIEEKSEKKWQ